MTDTTQEQVTRIVADHLGVAADTVTPDTHFVDHLAISARQSALLRRRIEGDLRVELPKHDAKALATVGDLIAYVEARAA